MEAELFKLNSTVQVTNPNSPVTHGLTKREYFAAMAMQGLLTESQVLDNHDKFAKFAVQAADALIAELNK
jgi:hypothetical protein